MNYTIELKTKENDDSPIATYLNSATELPLSITAHIVSMLMWDKNGELINEWIPWRYYRQARL